MTGGASGYIGRKFERTYWRSMHGPSGRQILYSQRTHLPANFTPANINRHTGKPHEHKREIARRKRQAGAK